MKNIEMVLNRFSFDCIIEIDYFPFFDAAVNTHSSLITFTTSYLYGALLLLREYAV